jgi:competence protein ComEC
LLCCLPALPWCAGILGSVLEWLIRFMNEYIERLAGLPFALWSDLSISLAQAILFTLALLSFCSWLVSKKKIILYAFLLHATLFMLLRTRSFLDAAEQKKIIVYNCPRYRALDLVSGRFAHFIGDQSLHSNKYLFNFHLKPSRILHRIRRVHLTPFQTGSLRFGDKNILLIDEALVFQASAKKTPADLVVLSGRPKIKLKNLFDAFEIRQVVLDATVPAWLAAQWKSECKAYGIACHDLTENGAFQMNL